MGLRQRPEAVSGDAALSEAKGTCVRACPLLRSFPRSPLTAHRTSNSPRHPLSTHSTPTPVPQVLFRTHPAVLSCLTSCTCAPFRIRHSARLPLLDSQVTRSGSPLPGPPGLGYPGDPPTVTSNSPRQPVLTQMWPKPMPKVWLRRQGLVLIW